MNIESEFRSSIYNKMVRNGKYSYGDFVVIDKLFKKLDADNPKSIKDEEVIETKKKSLLPYAIGAVIGLGLLLV